MSLVIEEYELRFTHVNEISRKFKENQFQTNVNNYPPPIVNFGVFLKLSEELPEEFFKWHILDISIQKASDNKENLMSIQNKKYNFNFYLQINFLNLYFFYILQKFLN